MALVLGVSIQDIITGEKEGKDNSVVTEIVRVASLQQREKKRNLVRKILLISNFILCIIVGYSAIGDNGFILVNDSIISYIVIMIISYTLVVYIWISEDSTTDSNNCKIKKNMKIVAFVLFLLSLIIGFGEIFMIDKDFILFGIIKANVGPFINGQIIGLFILNIFWFIVAVYMYDKKLSPIHSGWLLSVASMYLLALYGDLLHRLNSIQGLVNSLMLRSVAVVAILGLFLVFANIYHPF